MTDITLENFRCFGTKQTVPFAPLTLLVGENSTGKTSFMAMIRALWDLVFDQSEPDFNKQPYDLGSFDEIVHNGSNGGKGNKFFRAECSWKLRDESPYQLSMEFTGDASITILKALSVSHNDTWIKCAIGPKKRGKVRFGIGDNAWEFRSPSALFRVSETEGESVFWYFSHLWPYIHRALLNYGEQDMNLVSRKGAHDPSLEQIDALQSLYFDLVLRTPLDGGSYASAPVRSAPRRTYELSPLIRDMEGQHIPMYLSYLSYRRKKEWAILKGTLEGFGRTSGLFDEIVVRRLRTEREVPFQVEIGLSQNGKAVANRNLADVGYGVSQILPVLTELLRPDARRLLLLQQPEVHLHPSAQAALGSLFCEIARPDRRIVVETHSDYILDRVRMDIRDQKWTIRHEDVAILFFERSGASVNIHHLKLDTAGNIINAPSNYRQFFLQETDRLLRY